MPAPRKSQKQIAQRYDGNRRYFKRLNPFRRLRIVLAMVALLLTAAIALIYLARAVTSHRLEAASSPGPVSKGHSQFAQDCDKCHDPALKIDPLKPAVVNVSLDTKCETCHTQHTFHQVNVVADHSCTACHHEHLGAGPMPAVTDENCTACHGNAGLMAASAEKGKQFPASAFHFPLKDASLVSFQPPRPAQGYNQVFQSFAVDHPAFQIQRDNLTDPDTLKFNHKVHLTGDIPMVDGHKLDCVYCHQPDSRGAYMQPISFAKNCQACHSLQLDPTLPDFQIPHPAGVNQANSVRDFLLTLPTQYAAYATEKKGLTDPSQISAFVNEHMQGIRERIRAGADLEQEVFYADKRTINVPNTPASVPKERALFPGCAYCHEVKPPTAAASTPVVTVPVIPDRWLVHARFNHAAHLSTMRCEDCHGQALHSTLTSDILLPDKASCVTCHSPKGGVVSTCTTCHDYHNPAPSGDVASLLPARTTLPENPDESVS